MFLISVKAEDVGDGDGGTARKKSPSVMKRPISGRSSAKGDKRISRPPSARESLLEKSLEQHAAAAKIQSAMRALARRRKYIKSNRNLTVLRADSLLRIVDATRDESILHKAFLTSMEVEYLLLAKKAVARSVELLAKYFKSAVTFPVDVHLLVECVSFFAKYDRGIVDKGFDAVSVLVKLHPELLWEENGELCELVLATLATYCEDALLCFKATKCLYRMCERCEGNRASLGQLQGCLVMRKLFEVYARNTSMMENLAKSVINLCIESPANQDLLGEVGLCEMVFNAFIEHMTLERLFYLLCRAIINLCAGNHRANQDRLAKGIFPNSFVKAVVTYKAFPKAMEQLTTCILSIAANNKSNKIKFQSSGVCDAVLDLIAISGDKVILSHSFWALSTLLTGTGAEENRKELFDRALNTLVEIEKDSNTEPEVAKQATIAVQRMLRSGSKKGTPITFVPIKRPNTGNVLDKL